MPWLIAVIGPSKSGKTLLSKECASRIGGVVRASIKDMRDMLFNGKRIDEDLVLSLVKGTVQVLLKAGYNVIFDLDPVDLVYLNEILRLGEKRALIVLRAEGKTLRGRGAAQEDVESWIWEEPEVDINYVLELESEVEEDLEEIVGIVEELVSK